MWPFNNYKRKYRLVLKILHEISLNPLEERERKLLWPIVSKTKTQWWKEISEDKLEEFYINFYVINEYKREMEIEKARKENFDEVSS
jgi:hypothetical protein